MQHIIENEFLSIAVNTKGAEMCNITNKETGTPILWTGDVDVWPKHAPILFPYCGKLKNNCFTINNVQYEGGAHGFARDLEHIVLEKTQTSIKLILEANVLTMEKWPYAFGLISTYTLQGKTLLHNVEIINDGNEKMPFGFGFHPGFMCPFDDISNIQDYDIVFDETETPRVIHTDMYTGLLTDKTSVLFEGKSVLPLNDTMFNLGSICLTDLKSKNISLCNRTTNKKIVFNIENFDYVLLWSKPDKIKFLCIEPWHTLPDSENSSGEWQQKQPQIVLMPEEKFTTCMSITFEL